MNTFYNNKTIAVSVSAQAGIRVVTNGTKTCMVQ
jgi:hypothetical protein